MFVGRMESFSCLKMNLVTAIPNTRITEDVVGRIRGAFMVAMDLRWISW